jgi:hypothetical protein
MTGMSAATRAMLAGAAGAAVLAGGSAGWAAEQLRLSDEPIEMKTAEEMPDRVAPLVEIGPDFLSPGRLSDGVELPTGAVWTPALYIYGDYRTALNYFDDGENDAVAEWANRLDLTANLRLSGTERLVLGMSPLRDEAQFTGYTFEPDSLEGSDNAFNSDITALFFEGEIGEIFPDVDPRDEGFLDLGIAVGRQPLFFQEGLLVSDTMDSVALTRDQIFIPGISVDHRVTAVWGWNDVNRADNREDPDAQLFGLFTEGDWGESTVQIDGAYLDGEDADGSDDDGLFFGVGSTQRVVVFNQTINSSVRANVSRALDEESADVRDGALLFGEFSVTPHGTYNLLYTNLFWGIDDYTSAARSETAGGPLGGTGVLFAAVGLGRYGSPLSNDPSNAVGSAIGYQMFFNNERTQLILETGGRLGTDGGERDAGAVGLRIQQALGNRFVIRADGFVSAQEGRGPGAGARTEFVTRF